MPKSAAWIPINLDLLKPQGQSQKVLVKLLHWVLSAGRFIIVIVEIIVLAAFVARFKYDSDIADTKEAIETRKPFLEGQKQQEIQIRLAQFQIQTIKDLRTSTPDYSLILKKISDQTPIGVVLDNLNFDKSVGKVNFKMNGTAQSNDDLSTFVFGLKSDPTFSEINLSNISLDTGVITFSMTGSFNPSQGATNL